MNHHIIAPKKLSKIKAKGNNVSDLVEEIKMQDLFKNEFQNPLVSKLFKKVLELNKQIQKI